MPMDRFLIAPINTGLQKNVKSWQIMDDAFSYLKNAYVFRGRLRKRFGSTLMANSQLQSRLRVQIGTTNAVTGNLPPTNIGTSATQIQVGQMFSVGNVIFTVTELGAVATLTTDRSNVKITGAINTGVTPNTFSITGNGVTNLNTPVYYYPSKPVMGIDQYEIGAINNHPTYAFDTQYAYLFTPGTGWNRSGTAEWKGNDSKLFWTTNWQGLAGNPVLFVSNFNASTGAVRPTATDDPIWYFDGTNWFDLPGTLASTRGIFFLPNGGAPYTGPFVQTARIIVPFKNRLVLLNTIENNNTSGTGSGTATAYVNRCRYSWNGSPFAVNAWYEANQGDSAGNLAAGAGFLDAATQEQIVSAEFIKDRLIVYFERSTWELAYTGNEILPFVWQKLNTELGSQSTFSTIPFDKEALTIGQTGVHASNGSNVFRIDEKIPDEIFDFETKNDGSLRTVGIRDYYTELAIWAFVSDLEEPTQKFPNQVLIYNYRNGSWALFDDCFTFLGYFEQQSDTTWASSGSLQWNESRQSWDSGYLQSNQRQILAGTPEGFVLRLQPEVARNAPSMYITNIAFDPNGILTLKIINHNLSATPSEFPNDNDFILLENIVADSATMTFLNGAIFPVNSVVGPDTITINTFGGVTTGEYYGGGTAARVSNIQITTKQFNPYSDLDRNVYVSKIDFGVRKTETGAITVDYYPSSTNVSMIQGGVITGAIMGNSVLETSPYSATLYPLEQYQELLWHPVYFQTSGEFVQFSMYFTANQMINPNIALVDFVLEGMCLYTQPLGRLQ